MSRRRRVALVLVFVGALVAASARPAGALKCPNGCTNAAPTLTPILGLQIPPDCACDPEDAWAWNMNLLDGAVGTGGGGGTTYLGATNRVYVENGAGVVIIRREGSSTPAELRFTSQGNGLGMGGIEAYEVAPYGGATWLTSHATGSDNWPTGKWRVFGVDEQGRAQLLGRDSTTGPRLLLSGTESGAVPWMLGEQNGRVGLLRGAFSFTPSLGGPWLEVNPNWTQQLGGQVPDAPLGPRVNLRSDIGFADSLLGGLVSFAPEDGYPGRIAAYHSDNHRFPKLVIGGPAYERRWGHAEPSTPRLAVYPGPFYPPRPTNIMSSDFYMSAALSVRDNTILTNFNDPNYQSADEKLTVGAAEECAATARNICKGTSTYWNFGLQCSTSSGRNSWDGTSGGCGGDPCEAVVNESCGSGVDGTCSGGFCTTIPSRACTTNTDCGGGFYRGGRHWLTYTFEDVDAGDTRDPQQMASDWWGQNNCLTCNQAPPSTRQSRPAPFDVPSPASANGRGYKVKVTLPKLCYGLANSAGRTEVNKCVGSSTSCSSDADCANAAPAAVGAESWCAARRKVCTTDADCGGVTGACRYAPAGADRVVVWASHWYDSPSSIVPFKYPWSLSHPASIMPVACESDGVCGGGSGSCDLTLKQCKSTYAVKNARYWETLQPAVYNETAAAVFEVFPANLSNPAATIRRRAGHGDALRILYGDTHRPDTGRCECQSNAECGTGGHCAADGLCDAGDATRTACEFTSQCAASRACSRPGNFALGTKIDAAGNFWTKGTVGAEKGGGNVETCETWTVTRFDVTNAATAQTVTVATLPARARVTGVVAKQSEAWGDGAGPISTVTLAVGAGSGTTSSYLSACTVSTAVADATFCETTAGANTSRGPATLAADTVTATVTATGGNLSTLTTGRATVSVCYVVLPSA